MNACMFVGTIVHTFHPIEFIIDIQVVSKLKSNTLYADPFVGEYHIFNVFAWQFYDEVETNEQIIY